MVVASGPLSALSSTFIAYYDCCTVRYLRAFPLRFLCLPISTATFHITHFWSASAFSFLLAYLAAGNCNCRILLLRYPFTSVHYMPGVACGPLSVPFVYLYSFTFLIVALRSLSPELFHCASSVCYMPPAFHNPLCTWSASKPASCSLTSISWLQYLHCQFFS